MIHCHTCICCTYLKRQQICLIKMKRWVEKVEATQGVSRAEEEKEKEEEEDEDEGGRQVHAQCMDTLDTHIIRVRKEK